MGQLATHSLGALKPLQSEKEKNIKMESEQEQLNLQNQELKRQNEQQSVMIELKDEVTSQLKHSINIGDQLYNILTRTMER